MMRQNLGQLFRTLVAMVAVISLPAVALAAITGTSHDFSGAGWNSVSGEICIVCHTPHNADSTVTTAPLWNHEVTTATYSVYTSDTLNATTGQPDGVSLLCLSCHDGTVAIDSFAGNTGSIFITGDADVGTDLRDDHPISFVWTDAGIGAEDNGLNSVTDASGLGGTIDEDMLFGTKMQCASCHDAHGVATVPYFLVKSNAASDLCLTCHNK